MEGLDFLELISAELNEKGSIEKMLKKKQEEELQREYVANFSRFAAIAVMAKTFTKEERVAVTDFIHKMTVEAIEQELPGDLDTIAVCAKSKEMLLLTMDSLSEYFDK
jgi:hypothetical protein